MLRGKGRSRVFFDLGLYSVFCLLRGIMVRGFFEILGLKKFIKYIFIFGNEKNKFIGIVM